MKIKTIVLLILASALAGIVSAASLSDLNTKGFQTRVMPQGSASENPFLKRGISAGDLLVEDLALTGIVYNPTSSYALISGYVVSEGDDLAGFKVKVIERDHVVLKQLDQVKVLRIE